MENEEQGVNVEGGVAPESVPVVEEVAAQQDTNPAAALGATTSPSMEPPLQVEPTAGVDWKVKLAGALAAVAVVVILLGVFVASGIKKAQDTIEDIERASNQTELEDGWRVFDGEDFKAEFPAEVLTASERFPGANETIELETYQSASSSGSAYTVSLLKMTTDVSELESAIQSAVDAGAAAGGGVLVEDRYEPVVNGVARAYYKVSYPEQGAMQEAYLVATTDRFYQVIVIYENGTEPEEDIQRFMDSFEQK